MLTHISWSYTAARPDLTPPSRSAPINKTLIAKALMQKKKEEKKEFKSSLWGEKKKNNFALSPVNLRKPLSFSYSFPRIKCSTERLLSSAADIMLIAVQMSTLTPLHVVIQPQREGSEMALHLFVLN